MSIDISGLWKLWLDEKAESETSKSEITGNKIIEDKTIESGIVESDTIENKVMERPDREHKGEITLPGALQSQGYGNPISKGTLWVSGLHNPYWYEREEYKYGQEDGCKVPFLSQPITHYVGKAWYEKEIILPHEGRVYTLFLECTRWRSHVWVDGVYKGSDCSLITSHEIELGELKAGVHTITICIDNSFQYPYRPDGHGVSDGLGATWNGIAGRMELLTPSEIRMREEEKREYASVNKRQMEVKQGMFFVDGKPEYFRGTHFGGDYPLTGYPSTDSIWWEKLMKTLKEWGLNFIRCHSYCPPKAAFYAADKMGVYLQVECGMWNVFEEGIPMISVLSEETKRILKQFGHHPSFVLFAPSNEPGGDWQKPLMKWVEEARKIDEELGYKGRRVYTAQSGWPYDTEPKNVTGVDYLFFHRSGYGSLPNGTVRNEQGWRGKDYYPSIEGVKLPVMSHEMGQWCSYPDFSVMDKFTGYMQPGNYHVFKENARAAGVLDLAEKFSFCSGKLQIMMYKEDIEANFRTPSMYGFELLDFHDYLGQGTALVGIVDAFWEKKGYVKEEEFRDFCSETVLLGRFPSYVYKSDERVAIPIEVCHFGREEEKDILIRWSLLEEEKELLSGEWEVPVISIGKNQKIGDADLDFTKIKRTCQLTFVVQMYGAEGSIGKNQWDIFVFHKEEAISEGIIVKESIAEKSITEEDIIEKDTIKEVMDEKVLYTRGWKEAKTALEEGKRVIFSPYLTDLDYECPHLSMRPVFWNAQMGPGWGRSIGLVIEKEHPIFRYFPTKEYSGWQWEDILLNGRGFGIEGLSEDINPIVRVIDDWNRNLPQALLWEGQMLNGSLLIISANLEGSFKERPAAYTLKQALLRYASSKFFSPKAKITEEMIERHLFPVTRMKSLVSNLSTSAKREENLSALIDANPNSSVYLTGDTFPITIEIEFKKEVECQGLLYVPDQKDRMNEGAIKDYVIEVWDKGGWREEAKGDFLASTISQKAYFLAPVITKAVRLIVKSVYGDGVRQVWDMEREGWFSRFEKPLPVVQLAGLHILSEEETEGSDECFWNKNLHSTTKEIDN